MENDFRVRRRREEMALGFKLPPQCTEIVDLAVVDDAGGSLRVEHWLVASCQIDDREPAVAKTDPRSEMETLTVRPSVPNCIGHCLDKCATWRPFAAHVVPAGYPAHGPCTSISAMRAPAAQCWPLRDGSRHP